MDNGPDHHHILARETAEDHLLWRLDRQPHIWKAFSRSWYLHEMAQLLQWKPERHTLNSNIASFMMSPQTMSSKGAPFRYRYDTYPWNSIRPPMVRSSNENLSKSKMVTSCSSTTGLKKIKARCSSNAISSPSIESARFLVSCWDEPSVIAEEEAEERWWLKKLQYKERLVA